MDFLQQNDLEKEELEQSEKKSETRQGFVEKLFHYLLFGFLAVFLTMVIMFLLTIVISTLLRGILVGDRPPKSEGVDSGISDSTVLDDSSYGDFSYDEPVSYPPAYEGEIAELNIRLYGLGESESSVALDPADLYEQQYSSVVIIQTFHDDGGVSLGSGVILTEDGYILTCEHVIDECSECVVTLQNHKEYTAELVIADKIEDLALLKIDAEELDSVTFADSRQLRVGEPAYAIGCPKDIKYRYSMSDGIISGLGREFTEESEDETYYIDHIQTTAAINSGNSGGALFNRFGQVIGITDSILDNTNNMGFAISSNVIKRFLSDNTVTTYSLSCSELGFDAELINEGMSNINPQLRVHPSLYGLLIDSISDGSPLNAVDLVESDIITQINGQDIFTIPQFRSILADCEPDETVTITVYREEFGDAGMGKYLASYDYLGQYDVSLQALDSAS